MPLSRKVCKYSIVSLDGGIVSSRQGTRLIVLKFVYKESRLERLKIYTRNCVLTNGKTLSKIPTEKLMTISSKKRRIHTHNLRHAHQQVNLLP